MTKILRTCLRLEQRKSTELRMLIESILFYFIISKIRK